MVGAGATGEMDLSFLSRRGEPRVEILIGFMVYSLWFMVLPAAVVIL
jgi:hypothetical protein